MTKAELVAAICMGGVFITVKTAWFGGCCIVWKLTGQAIPNKYARPPAKPTSAPARHLRVVA